MLTIKHISEDGEELVIEVNSVKATKSGNCKPFPKHAIKVTVIGVDGFSDVFTSGTLYVMNSSGSTVSQWLILSEGDNFKKMGSSDHPVFGTDSFLNKTFISNAVREEVKKLKVNGNYDR